ncbi:MAG: zinc ribbon domain-containing protein [Planctomycetota bacterium]
MDDTSPHAFEGARFWFIAFGVSWLIIPGLALLSLVDLAGLLPATALGVVEVVQGSLPFVAVALIGTTHYQASRRLPRGVGAKGLQSLWVAMTNVAAFPVYGPELRQRFKGPLPVDPFRAEYFYKLYGRVLATGALLFVLALSGHTLTGAPDGGSFALGAVLVLISGLIALARLTRLVRLRLGHDPNNFSGEMLFLFIVPFGPILVWLELRRHLARRDKYGTINRDEVDRCPTCGYDVSDGCDVCAECGFDLTVFSNAAEPAA